MLETKTVNLGRIVEIKNEKIRPVLPNIIHSLEKGLDKESEILYVPVQHTSDKQLKDLKKIKDKIIIGELGTLFFETNNIPDEFDITIIPEYGEGAIFDEHKKDMLLKWEEIIKTYEKPLGINFREEYLEDKDILKFIEKNKDRIWLVKINRIEDLMNQREFIGTWENIKNLFLPDTLFFTNHNDKNIIPLLVLLGIDLIENYEHNVHVLDKTKKAITKGKLYELVKQSCTLNSFYYAAYLKTIRSDFLSNKQPEQKDNNLILIDISDLNHPGIKNYINKLNTNYQKPEHKKIAVLLPCSMKKPYSKSKSHKKFINEIKRGSRGKYNQVHELIITSPIGIIPRELEDVYPIKNYDTVLTGYWDREETYQTGKIISEFLKKNKYDKTICLEKEGYIDAAKEAEKQGKLKIEYTSLDDLRQTIESATKNLENIKAAKTYEKYDSVLNYEFGIGAGKAILEKGCMLKGFYPQTLKNRKNDPVGMINDSGFVEVKVSHGEKIKKLTNKIIYVNEEISGTNSLFAKHIEKKHDYSHIKPEDQVFLVYKDKVVATAKIKVEGKRIAEYRYGMLGRITKKIKSKK